MLALYARKALFLEAENIFKLMVNSGIEPNVVTYSSLIYSFIRGRDIQRAFYYHKQMIENNVIPNAHTQVTMATGILKVPRQVVELLQFYKSKNIAIAPGVMEIVLKGLLERERVALVVETLVFCSEEKLTLERNTFLNCLSLIILKGNIEI